MFLAHTQHHQAIEVASAVVGACRLHGGWSAEFQPRFLGLIFKELLDVDVDFNKLAGISIKTAKATFPSHQQRLELVELLVLTELLVNPVPDELARSVESWAEELGIHDRSLLMARDAAQANKIQAQSDFYRLMWMGVEDEQAPKFEDSLKLNGPKAWAFTFEPDEQLALQWRSLAGSPPGSLGAAVWYHYQNNGFVMPGEVGGANAALAHHDWLHVLGDYQVDVIGEVENAAFGSASSSIIGSTLWFLGVMAMYEGGLFDSVVAGGQQHIISAPGVSERIVSALRRGRACTQDLLDIDYFNFAERPLEELQCEWGISP